MFVLFITGYFDYTDNRKQKLVSNIKWTYSWSVWLLYISSDVWRLWSSPWQQDLPISGSQAEGDNQNIEMNRSWEIFILPILRIWSGLAGNWNNLAGKYLCIWEHSWSSCPVSPRKEENYNVNVSSAEPLPLPPPSPRACHVFATTFCTRLSWVTCWSGTQT